MIGDILQPTHLLFVLIVALLVLGPKRLPEAGRALGKGLRDFRTAVSGEEPEHNTISTPPTASTAVTPPPQFDGSPAPIAPAATATAPPPPAPPATDQPNAPAAESTYPEPQPTEPAADHSEPAADHTEPAADHTESAQPVS